MARNNSADKDRWVHEFENKAHPSPPPKVSHATNFESQMKLLVAIKI